MPSESTVADEITRLYGLDPSAFVAERNALAKAWRKAGRKDDATVVAALRRPSAIDSAINRAARTDPAVAVAWRAALDRAQRAQGAAIGGASADELRVALAALRSATAALADGAVRAAGGDAKRLDIANALQAMSLGAADQVVAGLLGSAPPPEVDPFAGAPDPPERPRPAPVRGRRGALAIVAPADPDDEARRLGLIAERNRLASLVETCRAAVSEADDARRLAEAEVERARHALSDAQSRLAAVEADLAAGS